jgi:hypothetical protein
MSETMHRRLGVFLKRTRTTEGKITIFTSLVGCLVLVCVFTIFQVNVPVASADDVQTSVTVLNTPPTFDTDVAESPASATTTPTNAGAVLSFTVQATDSSGDNYYLLICKVGGTATGNSGAAPTCPGGISNQWAVSGATASGAVATAATTTKNDLPFNNERNDWFAYICDNNATLARCNATANRGTPNADSASPFFINHIPVFYSLSNNSPQNPGGTVTWTTGSSDPDSLAGAQNITLYVCKTAAFNGSQCTTGGAWATSTAVTSNAGTSTPIAIPTADRLYNAYVYISDQYGLAATSSFQGSNSFFSVSNQTPSISAAGISLLDTDNVGNLTLTVPQATSGPFKVQFVVADNNGCLNASSTSEIVSNVISVYRSSATCTSGSNYDSNNCYASSSPLFTPFYSCAIDSAVNACSGATDSDVGVTCTFSLWYNADATDGVSSATSVYFADNWLAAVRATDDNASSSPVTVSSTGNELTSFLAFDVSTTTVAYGSLQPGETTTPMIANTDLKAVGNVGLDEDLYGSTMCTTWVGGGGGSAPDNCDVGGPNAGTKIPVGQQRVATSSIAYSSTDSYTLTASTSPASVLINVQKTTATSSPQTKNTYWGIAIPTTITLAGNYSGQNTIVGKKSSPANW